MFGIPLWIFLIPIVLQGALIFFDEFYFHFKRGLPKFERIGHPIDTFFFFLPLFLISFYSISSATFLLLCLLSCLIITKDEWIHAEKCTGAEQWTHAMLFILHPLTFFASYILISFYNPFGTEIVKGASIGIFVFMLYQLVYWNVVKKA